MADPHGWREISCGVLDVLDMFLLYVRVAHQSRYYKIKKQTSHGPRAACILFVFLQIGVDLSDASTYDRDMEHTAKTFTIKAHTEYVIEDGMGGYLGDCDGNDLQGLIDDIFREDGVAELHVYEEGSDVPHIIWDY